MPLTNCISEFMKCQNHPHILLARLHHFCMKQIIMTEKETKNSRTAQTRPKSDSTN